MGFSMQLGTELEGKIHFLAIFFFSGTLGYGILGSDVKTSKYIQFNYKILLFFIT